jgi:predicted small secreted protein
MKPTKKHLVVLALSAAIVAIFSSSCGTVQGFGHDVEHVGDAIEDSAR